MPFKRVLEPILFGCVSNLLITYIFSKGPVEFILEEFFVACLLAIPIVEVNKFIDRKLDKKLSWTVNAKNRFVTHLVLISISLVLLLNIIGSSYMWLSGKGFFTLREYIIINLVTLSLAFLLTSIRWGVFFYANWVEAESRVSTHQRIADDLRTQITLSDNLLEVQRGATKIQLKVTDIRLAKIEFGTVRIYSSPGEVAVFSGSLAELNMQLPEPLFFQVSRDAILHREAIERVTPSTYGKVQVHTKVAAESDMFIVSRLKASSFRRWYNGNSAAKT